MDVSETSYLPPRSNWLSIVRGAHKPYASALMLSTRHSHGYAVSDGHGHRHGQAAQWCSDAAVDRANRATSELSGPSRPQLRDGPSSAMARCVFEHEKFGPDGTCGGRRIWFVEGLDVAFKALSREGGEEAAFGGAGGDSWADNQCR